MGRVGKGKVLERRGVRSEFVVGMDGGEEMVKMKEGKREELIRRE